MVRHVTAIVEAVAGSALVVGLVLLVVRSIIDVF